MIYEISTLILLLLKLFEVESIIWLIVCSPIILKIIFFMINMILMKIQVRWLKFNGKI